MKTICVITSTRAEYGLLMWCIDLINIDSDLKLSLIVTGSHLSYEYGYTINEILKDRYYIDKKIDILLLSESISSIGKSNGLFIGTSN